MTTQIKNIYQRINDVRKSFGYVQKDKSVSTGGGSYKAVTHDSVTGQIRQHLVEHGVVIVPSVIEHTFHPKETPESKQRLFEAIYDVAFVNCDNPEDRIVIRAVAHALDNGDKAPGKAMSYATKYAILKVFSLETGEDEESRYQADEFDYKPHVDAINGAADMVTLQAVFTAAYKAAEESRNKEAQQVIIAAKNNRKAALQKGVNNGSTH